MSARWLAWVLVWAWWGVAAAEPAEPAGVESGAVESGAVESAVAEPAAVEPSAEPTPPRPPPPELTYEQRHLLAALHGAGLVPHPDPEGKPVAFIRVWRYPVFIPQEPFPTIFNALHVTTREETIAREVLVPPGAIYRREHAEETARNLRGLAIFSIVGVVPVRAPDPAQVGLLVVTRDLWSLRLETRLQLTGTYIDQLLVQLTERNVLGRDKRASVRFGLEPLDFVLGGLYVDPRLAGEPLRLVADLGLRFERATAEHDGFTGYFEFGRPLYDLRQRWSWSLVGQYEQYTARQAQRGELLSWSPPDCEVDCPVFARTWDHRLAGVAALGRVQLGDRWITRLAGGAGMLRLDADPNAATGLPASGAAREAFVDEVLPAERLWVYPTVNARFFENRHQTFTDLAGFGASEDMQLGPEVFIDARLPLKGLGSAEDLLDVGGSIGWRESWLGDGLVEIAAGLRMRWRLDTDTWVDRRTLTRLRAATPRLGFGRFVLRADHLAQADQLTPALVTLGGDNGLRGYPSQAYFAFGADRLRVNFEYRTAPWVVSFLHLGAVAFFDAGSVYRRADDFAVHSAAGLGLRMVVPQASSFAYRLDFGVPTDGSGFAVRVGFETSQAVPLTPREDALSEFSVGGLYNQP